MLTGNLSDLRPRNPGSHIGEDATGVCPVPGPEAGAGEHTAGIAALRSAPVDLAAWVVVGLLAGWIAGAVTGQRQDGCLKEIVIGVLGAFIGGALARAAGYGGIDELSLRSVLLAALGASLLLLVLKALEGRGRR